VYRAAAVTRRWAGIPSGSALPAYAGTALLAAAVAVFSWPVLSVDVQTGLDPSWRAALTMAAQPGGPDLTFTYGVLGFLRVPEPYYGWTSALSLIYVGVIHVALCATLLWVLRRPFPLVVAAALALVVASMTVEPLVALVAIWAVELLRRDGPELVHRVFPVAAGALAGVECLVKANSGVATLAVGAVAVLAVRRGSWRLPAAFLGTFAACALAGFVSTGHSPTDLPGYLLDALAIVSGYSPAMGIETPGLTWQYWAAGATALGVGVLAWRTTLTLPDARRVGVLLILAIVAFLMFKQSFVRHDPGHGTIYFGAMLGMAVAFLPHRRHHRTEAVLVLALVSTIYVAAIPPRADPRDVIAPRKRAEALNTQVRTALSQERRTRLRQAGRDRIVAQWGVDPETLALLRGHSVHVDPWESDVVWAYGLKWAPMPVMQSYSAYTPRLDHRNADFLRSDGAPTRILRHFEALDGRNPLFESPAAIVAMFCRYREVAVRGRWQVLARGPDRCGEPRELATVHERAGRPVTVPRARAGGLVVVEVEGAEPRGLEKLRNLAWRPKARGITLDGAAFRLVALTAKDGLVLSAPPALGYTPPFGGGDVRQIAVFGEGGGLDDGDELIYRFVEIPLA
jgi:hypothetical protein